MQYRVFTLFFAGRFFPDFFLILTLTGGIQRNYLSGIKFINMETDPLVNFRDTRTAFSGLGILQLLKQILLFTGMSNRWLSNKGKKAMTSHTPLMKKMSNGLKKMVFRHFCGGESVEGCAATIEKLSQQNILTILDFSAEGGESAAHFEQAEKEVLKTIHAAASERSIASAVFKVTSIARMELLEKVSAGVTLTGAETQEYDIVRKRVETLCRTAYEKNVRILIDAEHSWIQPAIDQLAEEMMRRFNRQRVIVFTTVQLYRKGSLRFLRDSIQKANLHYYFIGVKLVRGAYMDMERERAQQMNYPSPIHDTKEDTDHEFNEALRLCISQLGIVNVCIGTHNEASCTLLLALMKEAAIDLADERIFVAQLLGMSDHISNSLAKAGIKTAKYVPYGPLETVIPYLLRRVDENKSVQGESSRELSIRLTELKRRARISKTKNKQHGNNNRQRIGRPVL